MPLTRWDLHIFSPIADCLFILLIPLSFFPTLATDPEASSMLGHVPVPWVWCFCFAIKNELGQLNLLFSFCGISEHWYKACLRNVTGSSGHSRPSGRSSRTWCHFDHMESCSEPSEGLVAEGKGMPETMPVPEPAMLLQLLLPPSPPWHLALVPLWPQRLSTRVVPGQVGCSLGQVWESSLPCVLRLTQWCSHCSCIRELFSAVAALLGRTLCYTRTDNVMTWSSVLFTLVWGHLETTDVRLEQWHFFCWQYVLNIEDSNESFK